ncbi:hypothetical protein [Gloeothece verrucosa]|uniref:Uncharacterized protein n=1 Tax=Gloeothece verrucosa (strain PCC 7822) TaxID=497965 RepID=E0UAT5_GLOV7|nr:hypothetical protein [Gloeothece verrucosa]ADN13937.1 hypothetical protein Cyan7822_1954 [Gloeothece verrucosa PCC 7822]
MFNQPITKITKLQFNPQTTLLKDAKNLVCFDAQEAIPFWIWLWENPGSPIALPGKISLDHHDCLHAILGVGVSLEDEAFLIGVTMGSDTDLQEWHLKLFKFVSRFLYPKKFRFRTQDFFVFDLGVELGRKLKIKNLNKIDFALYENKTVAEVRDALGLNEILLLLNSELTQPQQAHSLQQFSFG